MRQTTLSTHECFTFWHVLIRLSGMARLHVAANINKHLDFSVITIDIQCEITKIISFFVIHSICFCFYLLFSITMLCFQFNEIIEFFGILFEFLNRNLWFSIEWDVVSFVFAVGSFNQKTSFCEKKKCKHICFCLIISITSFFYSALLDSVFFVPTHRLFMVSNDKNISELLLFNVWFQR